MRSRAQSPLVSLFLFATMALALPTEGWSKTKGWDDGGGGRLSMRDFIPRLSDGEAYTERYSFSADLDGGGHIGVNFTISNLGWGDGNGAAQVRVKIPGQKKYSFNKKVDRDEWRTSSKSFLLDIAQTKVTGQGEDTFVLEHAGDVKFKLTFKNTIPMWRPGRGRIDVDDGYFQYNMLAPRATVTGQVYIGGKWIPIKASRKGYADHVATNIAPYDFAKRFSRFRDYNKDVFVVWREIKLGEDYGEKSLTWVMIGYKNQVVFSDASATTRFGSVKRDGSAGYAIPYAVQLDASSGKDSIKLVHRAHKMKKKDLLASYGKAAKVVASTVSEPFRYDLKCKYTLQMTIKGKTATVQGKGHYTIDYINK